eukprot:CAMPEP_0184695086 /NCGR_PEP_ID=MMETSP0313-20130426/2831_1 /TAXON_ID=2792 /ORGANISM="Porphyridium aerugineum, Strain SAG 1380-2" /LENGTH=362 /DNA_ID=CAMNT_0027153479 /DNA_START=50 /DNA_END=1138 /DNA_ORIENTATION=-
MAGGDWNLLRFIPWVASSIKSYIQRNGATPIVLIVIAAAALLYSIRSSRTLKHRETGDYVTASGSDAGVVSGTGGVMTASAATGLTSRLGLSGISVGSGYSTANASGNAGGSGGVSQAGRSGRSQSSGSSAGGSGPSSKRVSGTGVGMGSGGRESAAVINVPGVARITLGCCVDDGSLFVFSPKTSGIIPVAAVESIADEKPGLDVSNTPNNNGTNAPTTTTTPTLTPTPSSTRNIKVHDDVAHLLIRLTRSFDLYLIIRVDDDTTEQEVLQSLQEIDLFKPSVGNMKKCKVLFCSTLLGRVSIVRQLEPQLHLDSNPEVVNGLYRFIKWAAVFGPRYLQDISAPSSANNILRFGSMDQLFL